MAYEAMITRQNPTALLFLLDQSGSMKEDFGKEPGKTICREAADAINQVIREFVLDCTKSYGLGDYFHIGVIGYADKAAPALKGALTGVELAPIKQIGDNPLRIEERMRVDKVDDGAGGLIEQAVKYKFPVWFDPHAEGDTAMCHALDYASLIIKGWVGSHPNCYPPIVINISDGEPKDGNPNKAAERLRSLTTTDGNVLLFNFHLSSTPKGEIFFPATDAGLPDKHARLLFNMSSLLTGAMLAKAKDNNIQAASGSRGFTFNVSSNEVLVKLLKIGTTTSGTQ